MTLPCHLCLLNLCTQMGAQCLALGQVSTTSLSLSFPLGALRSSCRMGGSPHWLILGALGRDRCSDGFLADTFPPPSVCRLEEEPGAAWLWSLWGWEATESGSLQGCLASLWETGSVLI